MKGKNFVRMLFACALLGLALVPAVQAADLVVVATPETYKAAQKWVDFLAAQMITLQNVAPADFAGAKKAEYLVLMGGMDEAGGIKDLVKEALGEQNAEWLSKPGAKKMYLRSDVWNPGQKVLIFAGSDRAATATARVDAKEEWWEAIAGWFDIETGGAKLPGY